MIPIITIRSSDLGGVRQGLSEYKSHFFRYVPGRNPILPEKQERISFYSRGGGEKSTLTFCVIHVYSCTDSVSVPESYTSIWL